jgi:hypothetical protein
MPSEGVYEFFVCSSAGKSMYLRTLLIINYIIIIIIILLIIN